MPAQVSVEVADALGVDADVLVLKYADGHYGLDALVADKLGIADFALKKGSAAVYPTQGKIKPKYVLAIGVGPLNLFEYQEISQFGLEIWRQLKLIVPAPKSVALTIHGPGYGLDERAALESLIAGLDLGATLYGSIRSAPHFRIVERSTRRSETLRDQLRDAQRNVGAADASTMAAVIAQKSERRLFGAVPFSSKFLDHWELGIAEAAHRNGFLCERLDHESFTGDIVTEIRTRIERSAAVVALLDGENPNVFLEVGYAWGVRKPAILLLHDDASAPFDVRGQRIVRYGRIGALRDRLSDEIGALCNLGVI